MILYYKPHSLIIQMNTREGDFYTHSAGVGQRGARWCVCEKSVAGTSRAWRERGASGTKGGGVADVRR